MFKVAVVGFGQIAQSYSQDKLLKKHYQYVSHVEVITDHPLLSLHLAVDPSTDRAGIAKDKYSCPHVYQSAFDIPSQIKREIDILVVATPPNFRLELIKLFPKLQAIILEKPIASTYHLAKELVDYCHDSNILLQVNLWRRADRLFRELSRSKLHSLIGDCLTGHVLYGNGIMNNGTHMIDMVRMFLGEVKSATKLNSPTVPHELPIKSDFNLNFMLHMESGVDVNFFALSYLDFRENSFDLIGTSGRLEIMNEGLTVRYTQTCANRSTRDTLELNHDTPIPFQSTVGYALYELYQNVIDALEESQPLVSSGDSALVTTRVLTQLISETPPIERVDLTGMQ